MVTLTVGEIRDVLTEFQQRLVEVRAIGGVALSDVVNGDAAVPDGYVLDPMTCYYVPEWWLACDDRVPT